MDRGGSHRVFWPWRVAFDDLSNNLLLNRLPTTPSISKNGIHTKKGRPYHCWDRCLWFHPQCSTLLPITTLSKGSHRWRLPPGKSVHLQTARYSQHTMKTLTSTGPLWLWLDSVDWYHDMWHFSWPKNHLPWRITCHGTSPCPQTETIPLLGLTL